jgi:2-hydroxychromene-2-carboxylate isomerase
MADNQAMPIAAEQRRWIVKWQEARAALRAQRAAELAAMSDEQALAAAETLLTVADAAGLPPVQRTTSGLVQQQALFHRKARS